MNSNPYSVTRIRWSAGIICLCALVIVGRLYWIQIAKGDVYSARADRQYVRPVGGTFDRGSIFFTSKDGTKVAAASVKDGYTLSINPKMIQDPQNVYEALSHYIDLDDKEFIEKASKINDSYEEIHKRLDRTIGDSILALRIPGVSVTKENWRVYPGNTLASQSVGLIGLDKDNNLAGRYGLERYYEDILTRQTDASQVNFFAELFSGIKKTVFDSGEAEGDIVTSIEPVVEGYLEKTLSDTQKKWKSDTIGGVIMNPKTGEIYALAELPTFNPNDLSDIKDAKVFSNALVENVYEMGSIMKPLTMAVGIDTGAITARSTYNDEGFLTLSGRKISNYDGKARGITPMQEVLSQSLNVGVAYIASKVGSDQFSKYFLSLGLGEKTGIDQPNEQKGIVKNLTTKRDVEIATSAYGQGIAMTPMETIRALSTLANGGMLVTPHIAHTIEYDDGRIEKIERPEPVRIFKKESVDDVTKMLINVVDHALKKGEVKMDRYSIAAKTGTAQIADPVNGGYYDDRYLHSFFGYFPAYNPEFIVFLYHVHPKGAEFASETLTDPFIQLVKLLVNYYEIPPDR